MNQIDLEGRVAVVTGGAQGLGFAIAQRLVRSGAKVSLWDMNAELLASARAELGDAASTILVDITDYQSVAAATAQVEQALGSLDILVNSAGVAGRFGDHAVCGAANQPRDAGGHAGQRRSRARHSFDVQA